MRNAHKILVGKSEEATSEAWAHVGG